MRFFTPHLRLAAVLLPFSLLGCKDDNITSPRDAELDRAKQATVKYANLNAALADGYTDINVVMPNMGRHFMKQSLVDEKFEVDKPEILVYSMASGTPTLVAVEYAIPLDKSASAPAGFTGNDDVWDHNTAFGLWLVHAWVHKDNPAGVFNPTNPSVP